MVFIKTDNRNCFSLNFLLGLDLVELDFSWNNTLMSWPIDFCCKRNKSPMCLCGSHLEMVKNMHSVSPSCKNNAGFLVSQSPCPIATLFSAVESFFWLQAVFTFGENTCLEDTKGLPSVISPPVTVPSVRLSLCPGKSTEQFPREAKAILPLEIFRLKCWLQETKRPGLGSWHSLEMFRPKTQEAPIKWEQALMSLKIILHLQAINRENRSFFTLRIWSIICRFGKQSHRTCDMVFTIYSGWEVVFKTEGTWTWREKC